MPCQDVDGYRLYSDTTGVCSISEMSMWSGNNLNHCSETCEGSEECQSFTIEKNSDGDCWLFESCTYEDMGRDPINSTTCFYEKSNKRKLFINRSLIWHQL